MTTARDDQPYGGTGSAPALAPPHVPLDERRYHRLGLLVLLLGLGGFGGWAFTAELSVSVVAPGYVAAESYRRTVQHLEGGIVREILVEDGDSVTAGQPLVVLDDTQARSQLQIMRSQYLIHRATELRLLAEQQGSATLSIPEELATSDLPRVQEVLALQQALFVARRESHRGALDALDEQVIQLRRQIEGLEETVRLGERHLASLSAEENDLRGLYARGLVDNLRLREVERDLLQLEGEVAGRRAEIGRLGSQLSENRMLREVRIQEFHKEVGEQLRDVQARVSEAEERIISLSDQVLRTTIRAPVAGTVVERRVHSNGDVVRPGDSLLDLVPAGDGFIIEARVPGRDVDRLYPGQAAEIRFTAFNQRQTYSSLAEVVYVSADSQVDEATGARFYRVRLKVSDTGRQALDGHMQLLAGMPAEVMIRTGERTFASYLLKPLTDMFARAVREA
ncbi:MAG: HlyD family type I secretion periplasmic adaptor subunit [Halomonas sp.]|nr:HlyD family type I secretion periplasmic adaptor subunit [Halomonas sp.]MDX5502161.1 HlyD family type I secretion periplasmic adaptor subunit [Halomonas sp.]